MNTQAQTEYTTRDQEELRREMRAHATDFRWREGFLFGMRATRAALLDPMTEGSECVRALENYTRMHEIIEQACPGESAS